MKVFKQFSLIFLLLTSLLLVSSSSCGSMMTPLSGAEAAALLVGSDSLGQPVSVQEIDTDAGAISSPEVENQPIRRLQRPEEYPLKLQDPRILYQAQPGDTLNAVAARFGVAPEEIVSSHPIVESGFIAAGQYLKIEDGLTNTTPDIQLLPDGEVVYSPSASDFDIQAYAEQGGGYLTTFEEFVPYFKDAEGWEVIEYVARTFSINPRLLFSLLEYNSHWVFGWPETDDQEEYPLGIINAGLPDLNPQVVFAAKQISEGYYGWRAGTLTELTFKDGSTMRLAPTLNAGTVGLMQFLSKITTQEDFLAVIDPENGLMALHTEMFGDPWQRAAETAPLLPDDLTQPEMILPFVEDELWFYSSGPHPAWSEVGSNAALDFTPQINDGLRCTPVEESVVASASGIITHLSSGLLYLDLDGDGDPHTGWVLLYLHLDWSDVDGLAVGMNVEQGQVLGHPSCLRGQATNTHIHIARMYNGEWMAAGGAVPFNLSGWEAHDGPEIYDGTMTREGEELIACFCGWKEAQLSRECEEDIFSVP